MGGGISNYHENIVLPLQAATTVFIAAAMIGFPRDGTAIATAANNGVPVSTFIYTRLTHN